MMSAKIIRQAIKRAECFEIDYDGMTDEEVYELDHALDTIFKAAQEHAEFLDKYKNLKVLTDEDIKNAALQ